MIPKWTMKMNFKKSQMYIVILWIFQSPNDQEAIDQALSQFGKGKQNYY